ncbi:MAG: metallophosphoesterase [Tepidisphaeraceae bacterium]
MGFILTVITILFALDALWLWQSDRFLRGVRGARWWRLASAAFVVLQILILVWIFAGRLMSFDPSYTSPKPLVAAVLIWHLLVLPVAVVLWAIPAIALAIVRALRSLFPVLRGEGRGEGRATFEVGEPFDSTTRARDRMERSTRSSAACPSPLPSPPSTWEREDGVPPTQAAGPASPAGSVWSPVSRRSFLRTAAVMTPPLVTTIATAVSMPQLSHFRVRRLTIPLPTLPPALDGLTIAQVSDIHVGRFTRGPILDQIVRATNDLNADLVLMTGDLINDALGDLDEALDLVQRIDPRHGLAMCEGNHDLIESRAEFERRTRAAGVPLLINEAMTVRVRGESIQLLGLRWGSATPGGSRRENGGDEAIASSMDRVLAQLRSDAFPILLAHHPHAFDLAAAAGIPLTLAGHTHGGQLMLTDKIGFGPRMYRYWSGLYTKPTGALVVSNGVGNWFPLRINAPAEIVHITLRRA